MIDRRSLISALSAGGAAMVMPPSTASAIPRTAISQRMADIERMSGGRLGVAALDLGSGARFVHRAAERFPMCSTFKASLAALVLKRVERGHERLDRVIPYGRDAIVEHSPVTEKHVGAGLSVSALCKATVTLSDNAAANLLLDASGGPSAMTAFWRGLGDRVSRLDRWETQMSESRPGDVRDTTSPAAMLATLRKLALGDVLSPASRAQLTAWLVGNRTGDRRLRAGLPAGWRVGDKTGSGGHGTTNDIAIVWPPSGEPVLISVFLTQSSLDGDGRNATLVTVARMLVNSGFGRA